MVLYLILCLVSVLAGCGILSLIGVDVDRHSTLFLTPVLALCSLTILMGGLVSGGFTVGQITPLIYALYLGSAVLGTVRHGRTVIASWPSLLIMAGLPLLILLPAIVEGIENYSGGVCMDGWAYVTAGQSLQQYPLGSEGWLPPAVQFTAQFGKAIRFISFSFLALLAPLSGSHNDTQEVLGHYFGWLFFVYGSACLFFARAARLSRPLSWTLVLLAMLSGWSLKLISANSVDNTLALCFLPAAFGIMILIPGPSIRHGVLLGAIMATSCYAYPESSPFTAAAILAIGAQRLFAAPQQLRNFGRMSLAALITLAVCISPFASQTVEFYRRQFTAATHAVGGRPGEGFYRLLSTQGYILPSYWGLTPDFFFQKYAGSYDQLAVAMAYVLTLAALVGVFLLLRRKDWSLPLFAIGMTAAYAITLAYFHYTYAGFKVLTLTWFAVVYVVVVAAEWMSEVLRRGSMWTIRAGLVIACGLLATVGGFFFLQERIFYRSLPFKSMRDFKKVSVLENLARGRPVAMVVKEPYANVWGTHFLRETKLSLAGQYRGSMTKSFLDRSEPVDPTNIRYVVTDDERSFNAERLLSKEGPYYIWDFDRKPWVLVTEVDNPFGMDAGSGPDPLIWITKAYTELYILSRTASTAFISAEFALRASLTDQASLTDSIQQRIRVATAAGFEEERVIGNGMHSFAVSLQPGLNQVLLASDEKAPLLIRATHLSVSEPPQGDVAQIRDLGNPNGLERADGDSFFWMGPRDTIMTISAPAAGNAQFTAILSPGPSLVDKSQAQFTILSELGGKTEQSLNWGAVNFKIPVKAGLNRIAMRATAPNVKMSSDSRTMMIGFRNLHTGHINQE